jgi:hypothetical protein
MTSSPMTSRQHLVQEVTAALAEGLAGEQIVDLIVRNGWQPRPVPDPNSEYLEGVLHNGKRVPIEIRHADFSRLH